MRKGNFGRWGEARLGAAGRTGMRVRSSEPRLRELVVPFHGRSAGNEIN